MAKHATKTNAVKSWAMYTYIAGDNNLSNAGLEDICEMEDAGSSADTHVAVQIDTEGELNGSIRYEISEPDFEGRSHRTVITRLPEQNTGNPKYLAEFARWAVHRYPAENQLLVVWNHGAGFMHTPTRDIGYDDSSRGDALTMGELRWALEKAGFGAGDAGKLAILGFDACLMNMLEVAYEFVGLTDLIVGSQQTEPGDGWPYDKVIEGMKGAPKRADVAAHIVKTYIADYKESGTSGVTQSALDLAKLDPVGKAVDELGLHLLRTIADNKGAILEARVKTQGYAEPTYVDMLDMVNHLAEKIRDDRVLGACAQVRKTVEDAIVLNGKYGGSVTHSCGLSIWYPLLKVDYVTRRSEYVALRYSKTYKNWSRFLDVMLAE